MLIRKKISIILVSLIATLFTGSLGLSVGVGVYNSLNVNEHVCEQSVQPPQVPQIPTQPDTPVETVTSYQQEPGDVSRVVLMIGDSMSFEEIDEAGKYKDLNLNKLKYSGSVQTANVVNEESRYAEICKSAQAKGLGVAVVSTDVLFQGSPATFSSFGVDKNNFSEVRQSQYASGIDLFLGADKYDSTNSTYIYASEKDQIEAAGYKFINNLNYKTITQGQEGNIWEYDKIFGAFNFVSTTQYTAIQDRSKTNLSPCLGQMTDFAILYMEEKFPQGYVLIIESNHIAEETEKLLDDSQAVSTTECIIEFDRCVGKVKTALDKKLNDYALIVTAGDTGNEESPYFVENHTFNLTEKLTASDLSSFMKNSLKEEAKEINKVIMMIGDGMGLLHVECAENYLEEGKEFNMKQFAYSGAADALTLSGGIADSGAGGTALATGIRVNTNYISTDANGNELETISEVAKKKNMGVAILTTDYLYEATPAAFSSHALNRSYFEEIRQDQYASNIDLFLGADDDKAVYSSEKDLIENAGYTFSSDFAQLDYNSTKIFGAFPKISMSSVKAPANNASTNQAPCLSQMVEFAIQWMEIHYGEAGYFIMIEDNDIDVNSEHHNDNGNILSYQTGAMVESLMELDRCVGIVKDMLEATGDNYAIVISADHSAGGMSHSSNREGNYGFWTTYHDAGDVPYYIDYKAPETVEISVPKGEETEEGIQPILNIELAKFVFELLK